MPGGEAVVLGPFTGGLNNYHDPDSILDEECQELTNFEVDTDGSLKMRPPIQELASVGTSRTKVIGSGIFTVSNVDRGFIFASGSQGLYYYRSDTTTWTYIVGGPSGATPDDATNSTVAVQYGGYVYVPADPWRTGGVSGRWSPSTGWDWNTSFPDARSAIVYKDRMYVARGTPTSTNSSRVWFSEEGDPFNWPASNFFDVSPGDGQNVVDFAVVDDNLLIFKEDSTYVYGYDANPADGILRVINTRIGASKHHCVAQWENSTFVFHDDSVYEITNFQFTKINPTVVFDKGAGATLSDTHYITLFGDRLLVRVEHVLYSFNLLTRTWSVFRSENSDLNSIGLLAPLYETSLTDDRTRRYIGASAYQAITKTFQWWDSDYRLAEQERAGLSPSYTYPSIICAVTTKNFNFNIFHAFKRMFWWGVELFVDTSATGSGFADTVDYGSEYNTFSVNGPRRVFIKLKKSLRFRRINFRVEINTGTQSHQLIRLFNIVPILKPKSTLSKKINDDGTGAGD